MYNYTNGSTIWENRTAGLLSATATFFTPSSNATNIMYEPSCELDDSCNTDQLSFKAYLSRFMWATAKIAPFTSDAIQTLLQASASGAAEACTGGTDGTACGAKWYVGSSDGTAGAGQQMSALEVIQGLLINETSPVIHSASVHLSTVKETNTTTQAPIPVSTFVFLTSSSNSTVSSSRAPGMAVRPITAWLSILSTVLMVSFM